MAALAGAVLAGCQTDQARTTPSPTTLASSAGAPPARTQADAAPRTEAAFEASEPLEFAKIQSNIPHDALIGVSIGQVTRCYGLRPYQDRRYHWDETLLQQHGREFAGAFFQAAHGAGLDVTGDPRQLFGQREDRSRAVFAIAAEITHIRFEICDHMHWFLEYRLDKMSGDSQIGVVWHVYDKLQRKVIHTEETVGRFQLKEAPAEGAMAFILGAFSDATRQLAQRPAFRRAVAAASDDEAGADAGARAQTQAELELLRLPAFAGALSRHADEARKATVTIDLGDGHGSGFLVDRRGYILTNHHVVGERRRVRVQLSDGTLTTGEVLRRDKARDVALVKIEGSSHPALPIRSAPAAVAEEVNAIGAPLDPALSSSVTRGVVGALRRERNGLVYIQADVSIQPGSSGGPLVDQSGNVVGISVAVLRDDEGALTGVNFFIPIQDALDRLKLKLVDRPMT